MTFVVGETYARRDIFRRLGLPANLKGGPWFTGLVEHAGEHYIFCGVQALGRTGHGYENRFLGDDLLWRGRARSRLSQPSIQAMLARDAIVRVFYRHNNRDPFVYAGQASAAQILEDEPVGILWSFADDPMPHIEFLPGEIPPREPVTEGSCKTVKVNIYERDPSARRRCIEKWGTACSVCGIKLSDRYGDLGDGFIHVHHVRPLGDIREEYLLDPENDLRPVCPNCHAMLHRRRPMLTIEELKLMLR